MNERPAARTRMRSRRALVLALALGATLTLAALAGRLNRTDPEAEAQRVHPEVEAQMRMLLSRRHAGELFPFPH